METVTPYGGVWIEMLMDVDGDGKTGSRLMEACGLKFPGWSPMLWAWSVTPYGGVWIEIL